MIEPVQRTALLAYLCSRIAVQPRTTWLAACFLIAVVLTIPLLAVSIPPLIDYPDHLARMYIFAHPENTELRAFYSPAWGIVPYAATDGLGVLLQQAFSIRTTGRILLGLGVFLPLAGGVVYSRMAIGRWSPWTFCMAPFAYGTLFLMGFYNFYIGCGLALFAASAWMALRRSHATLNIILAMLFEACLFLFHLYAGVFYLILIGSVELAQTINASKIRFPSLRGITGISLRLISPTLVLCLFSYVSQHQAIPGSSYYIGTQYKLTEASWSWAGYPVWETELGLFSFPILFVACYRRWIFIPLCSSITTVTCLILYLVLPSTLLGAEYFSPRFAQMAAWVLLATMQPARMSAGNRATLVTVLVTFLVWRVAATCIAWNAEEKDLADVGQVISTVEPGSKVLYVMPTRQQLIEGKDRMHFGGIIANAPAFIHFPALLVFDHSAFYQLLLSVPGTSPLKVNPAYLPLSKSSGVAASYLDLNAATRSQASLRSDPYLADWQHGFDYVLVLETALIPDVDKLYSDRLMLVASNNFAALYRIKKSAS